MALAKAVVEIPLAAGYQQGVSEHATGSVGARFLNAEPDRLGLWRKRAGVREVTRGKLGGGQAEDCTAAWQRTAPVVQEQRAWETTGATPGVRGARVLAWSEAQAAWAERGSHTPWCVRPVGSTSPARATSGTPQRLGIDHSPHAVSASGHLFFAWIGESGTIYVRVLDESTGTVILEESPGEVSRSLGAARWLRLHRPEDGTVVLVWVQTGAPSTLRFRRYTAAAPHTSSDYTIAAPGDVAAFDSCHDSSGDLYLAVLHAGTGAAFRVLRVDNLSGTLVTSSADVPAAGTSLGQIACAYTPTGRVLVAFRDSATLDYFWLQYTPVLLPNLGPILYATSATFVLHYGLLICGDAAGRVYAGIGAAYPATVPRQTTLFRYYDSAGALISETDLWWCDASTAPWYDPDTGGVYLGVHGAWTETELYGPGRISLLGYAVLCLTDAVNEPLRGGTLCAALLGTTGVGAPRLVASFSAQKPERTDASARLVALTEATRIFASPESGVVQKADAFRARALLLYRDSSGLSCGATYGETLALGGAVVDAFDGAHVVEHGFVAVPTIIDGAMSAAATGIVGEDADGDGNPDATYLYVVLLEWEDLHGRVHRSLPSAPLRVTPPVGGPYKVDLVVRIAGVSRRFSDETLRSRARLAVYRTVKNGTVPYLLPVPAEHWTPIQATVAVTDDVSDQALLAAALGAYPYAGGVLEAYPPPPARQIAACLGRLFVTSATDPEVWTSSEVIEREAPGFHPANRLALDGEQEILGTAPLDNALVIFGRSAVYLVDGSGPDPTGAPGWGTPQQLAGSPGCVSSASIVAFDGGVFYLASKALYLVTRSRGLVPQDEVADLIRQYPEVLSATVDRAGRRVLFLVRGGGRATLCYHYGPGALARSPRGVWTLLLHPTVGAAHTLLPWHGLTLAGAALHHEDEAFSPDLLSGVPYHVGQAFETPWIRIGALGSYQRVWRVFLELEATGVFDLRVEVYVDSDDTVPAQTEDWTEAEIGALPGYPRVRLTVGLRVQKCHSLKVRIRELGVSDPSQFTGFTVHGVSVEVGAKLGVEKAQKAHRR